MTAKELAQKAAELALLNPDAEVRLQITDFARQDLESDAVSIIMFDGRIFISNEAA